MAADDRGSPKSASTQLAERVTELLRALRDVEPSILATRTGTTFTEGDSGTGDFRLAYWEREVTLSYPDFSCHDRRSGEPLGTMDRAMLAYYFNTSDGSPPTGCWIAFSELPGGTFYAQAFQGYTGNELAKVFVNDFDSFARAARDIAGRPPALEEPPGDMAFVFQALPHVALMVVCWLGDEEFPPSYRVLFDAGSRHHLATDAYAILGSALTRRLIKAYEKRGSVTGEQGCRIVNVCIHAATASRSGTRDHARRPLRDQRKPV